MDPTYAAQKHKKVGRVSTLDNSSSFLCCLDNMTCYRCIGSSWLPAPCATPGITCGIQRHAEINRVPSVPVYRPVP